MTSNTELPRLIVESEQLVFDKSPHVKIVGETVGENRD